MSENRDCPMQPDLERLTASLDVLSTKFDDMIAEYRTYSRYLLIVVCIIALGRTAFDLTERMLNPSSIVRAEQEGK